MSQVFQDVFTAEEVARAARVPRSLVQALIDAGEARLIAGTPFLSATEAVQVGRRLRAGDPAPAESVYPFADATPEPLFAAVASSTGFARRRSGIHALASSFVHAALLVAVLWLTAGPIETAPADAPKQEARMVFLMAVAVAAAA
jgi:hypothetical protein